MKQPQGDIRIYVACLAAYSNGILHGCWVDATQDVDDIHADIQAMLKASPMEDAEEWAIHDHEGFEGADVSDYMGIAEVAELAAFIAKHGEIGGKLVGHFGDLETARKAIEEDYAGEYASLADFAEELTEQTGDIPEHLRYYIDYERMGRDMAIGDVFTIETGFGQVHVFWSR